MFHCGCARGISFHREFLSERRTLTIRKSEQAHNGTLVLPALYWHLDLGFGSSALMSGIAAHLKNDPRWVLVFASATPTFEWSGNLPFRISCVGDSEWPHRLPPILRRTFKRLQWHLEPMRRGPAFFESADFNHCVGHQQLVRMRDPEAHRVVREQRHLDRLFHFTAAARSMDDMIDSYPDVSQAR